MYVVVSLCVNLKYVLQIDPVFQLEDMSLCVQICSVQTICFVSACQCKCKYTYIYVFVVCTYRYRIKNLRCAYTYMKNHW